MEFDPLGILGRKWSTASKAETRELSDCVRVTLTWPDGETRHFLEDNREGAVKTLAGIGFAPCAKA